MDGYAYGVNGNFPSRFRACADYATVSEFLQQILDGTVNDFSLANFMQNDSDYLVGIKFFPINVSLFVSSGAVLNSIIIGKKLATTTNTVKWMNQAKNSVIMFSVSVARRFNNFLDFEPYTKIRVFVPYIGFIEVPCEEAYGAGALGLTFHMAVDFTSGNATVYVYGSGRLITSKSAKISIDVPLGKTNAEEQQRNKVLHSIKAGVSIASLGIGAVTGNPLMIGGALALGGNVASNALNDSVSRLSSYDGGTGGADSLAIDKTCFVVIERPTDAYKPDAHVMGRPCRQSKALSTLSGFTKVGDIHFDPMNEPIFQDEIEEIVNLLHAGVIL